MARLVPEVNIDEIGNLSERDVARALTEGLPADCLVIHSYPWLRESEWQGRKHINEGETDFLIIHPSVGGLLTLEVKGGDVRYDNERMLWYRPGQKKTVKDPFTQASKGMHYFKTQIMKQLATERGQEPFSFGYAVVFPDCDYSGPMPPGANNSILLGRSDMEKLGEKLTKALRLWGNDPAPLSREKVQKIKQAVFPEFHICQVLSRKVAHDEEILIRLTENQINILQMLAAWPQALIEGVAGSGKTLLAMTQAQRFAAEGRKVLFTCFNRKLADWLQSLVPEDYRANLLVKNFHSLARDMCQRAGVDFKIPEDKAKMHDFWRLDVPALILEAAANLDQTFDAIVVDEGQDFMPEWWDALHCLNTGGAQGRFYVFYDPAQNIFAGNNFCAPLTTPPFRLPHNCRNTREIAKHCSSIINTAIAVMPNAPQGTPCTIKTVASESEAIHLLQKTLDAWIHEGMKLSQIAVLSLHKRADTLLKGKQKVGNCKISDNINKWQANETALFETIRSFKGLEADAIILYAMPEPDSDEHFSRADYYVAASRAKHLLHIIELRP